MSKENTVSRRHFLRSGNAFTGASLLKLGVPSLAAITTAACTAKQESAPFSVLSAADAADLEAMSARIMPTTDTPGATEAGVIYFFDRALGDDLGAMLPFVLSNLAELNGAEVDGHTFRHDEGEVAMSPNLPSIRHAKTVGGSSVHFSANFWRLRPSDFKERSMLGAIGGTSFADWPITYEELEPYYTKVEWEVEISGAPGSFDAARSKPFSMPPLPIKSCGVLMEKGAKALGLARAVQGLSRITSRDKCRLPVQQRHS